MIDLNSYTHTGIDLPGGRRIGHDASLFIIAEAGGNHNGDLGMALDLVDVAAEAGADAVKFQTFLAEHIILRQAPKAQYHIDTTGPDSEQSWFELLKTQELDRAQHEAIMRRCAERGILFMSTPYDTPSVDILDELDIALYKIASTDADNIPLLRHIASKGRPMILSTAMCAMEEVVASVEVIRKAGTGQLAVMQCTGSYPAPADQANLLAMHEIARRCNVAVGYSDHVPGGVAAISAVALGACCYEKHFTLNRNLPGPDHRASLEPDELKALVRDLRMAEQVRGSGSKQVMPCEVENRDRLRKRLVAARAVSAGTRLTADMVTAKRTGGAGLPPSRIDDVIGRTVTSDIEIDSPIGIKQLD